MKNCIDSIDPKYCFKTNSLIRNQIKLCNKCKKIPLPSFKCIQNIHITYCQSCYLSYNMNESNLITPCISEYKLLQKLVISCKNFDKGSRKEFNLNTLHDLTIHLLVCELDAEVKNKFINSNKMSKNDLKSTNCSNNFLSDQEVIK